MIAGWLLSHRVSKKNYTTLPFCSTCRCFYDIWIFKKTWKNCRREFIYSLQKRSIEKRVIAQGVLVHVLLSRHRIPARFYARYRRIDADASVARASVDENGIKPRWFESVHFWWTNAKRRISQRAKNWASRLTRRETCMHASIYRRLVA